MIRSIVVLPVWLCLSHVPSVSAAESESPMVSATIVDSEAWFGSSGCIFPDDQSMDTICTSDISLLEKRVVYDFGLPQTIRAFRHRSELEGPNDVETIKFYTDDSFLNDPSPRDSVFVNGLPFPTHDLAIPILTLHISSRDEIGLRENFTPINARYAVWSVRAPETVTKTDDDFTLITHGYVHGNITGIQFFAAPEPTCSISTLYLIVTHGIAFRRKRAATELRRSTVGNQ